MNATAYTRHLTAAESAAPVSRVYPAGPGMVLKAQALATRHQHRA